MIETVHAYADIDSFDAPDSVYDWVTKRDETRSVRWRRGRGNQALTSGNGWVVRVQGSQFKRADGTGGGLQVWAEANLTALLYGVPAKSLTLPAGDVARGLREMVSRAGDFLPDLAPRTLAAWHPSRVDASATWLLPDTDVALVLADTERVMRRAETASRRRYVRQSSGSHRMVLSKSEQVRVYDKRAEAYGLVRPPRWLADDAGLVRVEEQVVSRRARALYGDTLAEMAEKGADVARERITRWLDRSGPALASAGLDTVVRTAVGAGVPADAALRLGMLSQVFGTYDVAALVEMGLSQRTAYRWASMLRDGLAGLDPEGCGVLLDVRDAALASREYERTPDSVRGPFAQGELAWPSVG